MIWQALFWSILKPIASSWLHSTASIISLQGFCPLHVFVFSTQWIVQMEKGAHVWTVSPGRYLWWWAELYTWKSNTKCLKKNLEEVQSSNFHVRDSDTSIHLANRCVNWVCFVWIVWNFRFQKDASDSVRQSKAHWGLYTSRCNLYSVGTVFIPSHLKLDVQYMHLSVSKHIVEVKRGKDLRVLGRLCV